MTRAWVGIPRCARNDKGSAKPSFRASPPVVLGCRFVQRTMTAAQSSHFDLQAAAKKTMVEHGFEPEFPPAVVEQLSKLTSSKSLPTRNQVRDLRDRLWSSIDNDTSRDLDQIEVAEAMPDGSTKVLVGIADVDAFVPKDCPIDEHAAKETTTVYTGVRNFSMLPEQLSTGLTSL